MSTLVKILIYRKKVIVFIITKTIHDNHFNIFRLKYTVLHLPHTKATIKMKAQSIPRVHRLKKH